MLAADSVIIAGAYVWSAGALALTVSGHWHSDRMSEVHTPKVVLSEAPKPELPPD